MVRKVLAEGVFKVPLSQIRVVTHDVGGGFGMKVQAYSGICRHALCGAPASGGRCKWCASRLESFLSDTHGRDGMLEGELALDADGKFLGAARAHLCRHRRLHVDLRGDLRDREHQELPVERLRIPAIHIDVKMVLTNAAPLGPYRGAGRPEAIYLIERLIDGAARAMRIDRVELRRRNLIPPPAMPYKTPNGPIYDSGEFEADPGQGARAGRLEGLCARAAPLRSATASCAASASAASSRSRAAFSNEKVDLRFEADGKVAMRTGVQAMGQGHLSTFVPHCGASGSASIPRLCG